MSTTQQCREEVIETTRMERQRIASQRTECRQRPIWHPLRWFCEVKTLIDTIWLEVTDRVNRTICATIDPVNFLKETFSGPGGDNSSWLDRIFGALLTENKTLIYPIIESFDQQVTSRKVDYAETRSFIMGTQTRRLETSRPYRAEGAHIEAKIEDGVVHWRINQGDWVPFAPTRAHYPHWVTPANRRESPRAVTYNYQRLPPFTAPPRFDMIAAGGDRFIAKVEDTDEIYVAILEEPYVHQVDSQTIKLPQSFFKLDPLCGQMDKRPNELIQHVQVPNDDETHAATERFPLFRALYLQNCMYVDFMTMWFAPRIWHQLDNRPRHDTSPPPKNIPGYVHITYRGNFLFRRTIRKYSIKYEKVLDLGVGISHLHEQHDARFGGETDSLSGEGGSGGRLLQRLREHFFGNKAFDYAYRYANGPYEDSGGWIDGTCIYFMLVQLRADKEIKAYGLKDAFGVLWSDEQLVFTERWRLLHLRDNVFTSPFQPMVGIITKLRNEFYPGHPFNPDNYFCPFEQGHITSESRMVVARQFVVVTGIDPITGQDEIYSTTMSWGTMDKTWRKRPLPASSLRMNPDSSTCCDPFSLSIRQDSTISVAGSMEYNSETMEGRWVQRVLPSSGQEIPESGVLSRLRSNNPPREAYAHPWRFVTQNVYSFMHAGFSHFGVLEEVDSRIQCYTLTGSLHFNGLNPQQIESTTWVDRNGALIINHTRLDWREAAALLTAKSDVCGTGLMRHLDRAYSSGKQAWNTYFGFFASRVNSLLPNNLQMPVLADIQRRIEIRSTRASKYHQRPHVRIVQRAGVGWIMMHADERDDKMLRFNTVQAPIVLQDRDNVTRTISIRIGRHYRDLRDANEGPNVNQVDHAISPPMVGTVRLLIIRDPNGMPIALDIRFVMSRPPEAQVMQSSYLEWVAFNVWQIRMSSIDMINNRVVEIFKIDRSPGFDYDPASREWSGRWQPTANDHHGGMLWEMLSEQGAITMGTSIWFVGVTGLAAPADHVIWEAH